MIEAGVHDEVWLDSIANGEERPYGVAAAAGEPGVAGGDKWLGDVPELAGDVDVVVEALRKKVMGDGERNGVCARRSVGWVS